MSSPRPTVLGVVPVRQDQPDAPDRSMALRPLLGVALVRRAVATLIDSGLVGPVLVPTTTALAAPVERLLTGVGAGVEVLPVPADDGPALVLAALRTRPDPHDPLVVVHDPLHPLAPAGLVGVLLAALADDGGTAGPQECAGVVPVRAVTDTLKRVDADDVITATADREGYRVVSSPQAYRVRPLLSALRTMQARPPLGQGVDPGQGIDQLPRQVRVAGGGLRTVPAPDGELRLTTPDDLVLAEAILAGSAPIEQTRAEQVLAE